MHASSWFWKVHAVGWLDAEQFALTEQLFGAAFGELSVVAGGQPNLLPGKRDFGWALG